jgi:hypothetical protein
MQFTLTIDMDNAAFEDEPVIELGRLVSRVGQRLYDYGESGSDRILDSNGNTVGRWEITA